MTESSRIEYKRELSDSLEKDAVSFLNSKEGGVIVIGIDPKTNKPVGLVDCLRALAETNFSKVIQSQLTKNLCGFLRILNL